MPKHVTKTAPQRGGPRPAGVARRRAILDAALTVFADRGFDGASTRAIAAAAGVEQGHLAYYFETKELLWREVIRTHTAEIDELLEVGLRNADLRKSASLARNLLPRFLAQIAENGRLTRLMLQEFSVASPRHDWVVREVGRPIWRRLEPLFGALHAQGITAGALPTFSYYMMVGAALVFFGSRREVQAIAGIDPVARENARAFVDYLIESAFHGKARIRRRSIRTAADFSNRINRLPIWRE